ncbi:MAG: hypothetical protein B7Z20_03360, partial [Sphingobium sp. 32-64-5]
PVLAAGGCNILLDGAKAPQISATILNEGITASFMPPTLIYSLIDHANAAGIRYTGMRHLIYGAAPMPMARIRQAQEVFGPHIAAIYGQTEAPTMISAITARELAQDENIESVGRPCPFNDVQIMGPDGTILPSGETGEVVIRGDLVMRGYLNRPDLTEQTIVDGWLHTGDLGSFDERGYLFLKDRLRDVIISGGFNVYPADVETVLASHPDVAEASVIARPDDYWGQRVEAAVVLRQALPRENWARSAPPRRSTSSPRCRSARSARSRATACCAWSNSLNEGAPARDTARSRMDTLIYPVSTSRG